MVEQCNHPVRIEGMCGCCGADVNERSEELFTLLHNNTSLLLNKKEAERVNEEMYTGTVKSKRLVLLLDLDQTVIHTSASGKFKKYFEALRPYLTQESPDTSTPDNETAQSTPEISGDMTACIEESISKEIKMGLDCDKSNNINSNRTRRITDINIDQRKRRKLTGSAELLDIQKKKERTFNDIREIKIEGHSYYVKLRDNLQWFLEEVSKYYEIHIYTMGNKSYACSIAGLLDPTGKLFGSRIISRDDNFGCFDKDIKRLFPTNSKHVVILDDRPDVWGFVDNLYPIRPYYYFQTDDINSPEALQGMKSALSEDVRNSPVGEVFRNKNDLIELIDRECILTYFDNELEKVLSGLKEVHTEFFSTQQDTASILKKKKEIFKGCTAEIFSSVNEYTLYLNLLFKHHGGQTFSHGSVNKVTHLITTGNGRIRSVWKNKKDPVIDPVCVQVEWMHESIYAFKRLDEKEFILNVDDLESAQEEPDTSTASSSDGNHSNDELIDLEDSADTSNTTGEAFGSSDDSLYKKILDDN
ncbi:RNA polymerase II subunit A C-terminal domain phosphatase [Nematocida parisii]|nr:RNA polymerase II subunit A C-terminal domain phosphatase [Nematocida parisii]